MPEPSRSSGGLREVGGSPLLPPDGRLEDELDVGWYIHALQRRWKLVVAGALLGAIVGLAVSSTRPTLYEGVTTLLVVPSPKTPTVQINSATFRAILENASLASQVIGELGLNQAPYNLTPQRFLEDALAVEEVRGTNVVRVRVKLRDPNLAADASRRLAQKALTLTRQLNQQEGVSTQEQLKNHLNDAAGRMAAAEKELLSYQQRAQVELLKEDTQALLEERGDLLKLVIAIESETARLKTAEKEIERQKPVLSVSRAVGAEEALRRLEQRDREADRPPAADTAADPETLDLTSPFVNPVYQTLDFQIATSRARLAGLEQQRRQLLDKTKLGGEELTKLSELYRRQIELARLQTNFDLTKRVYSDLLVRYEESRTQALGNSPQLQLVDDAIPPDGPLSRRRVQSAALGLATGLLVALLAALAWATREGRTVRGDARA